MLATMQRQATRASARCPAMAVPRAHNSRRAMRVVAQAAQSSPLVKAAANFGLDASEGFFGFNTFAEQWCGRWAMIGFVSSIVAEASTGKGTLQQLGLSSPSNELLVAILALTGLGVVVGTASTASRLVNKKMSAKERGWYKNFLGLNNQDDWQAEARRMKQRGDFTTPGYDEAAIAAVRAQGMAADKFLAVDDGSVAQQAASEMKANDGGVLTLTKAEEAAQVAAAEREMKAGEAAGPSVSLAAAADIKEQESFYYSEDYDLKYARGIELSNGRAAMVGFWAAILVEAATGKGIILQLIMYAKLSGLLGPMSGF